MRGINHGLGLLVFPTVGVVSSVGATLLVVQYKSQYSSLPLEVHVIRASSDSMSSTRRLVTAGHVTGADSVVNSTAELQWLRLESLQRARTYA